MITTDFLNELDAAVTVCDHNGTILYMNLKSQKTFEKYGGEKLVGQKLLDCHPEPARSTLAEMMKNRQTNAYTIEKKGVKKIIIQKPWYVNGEYQGYIEISSEIPFDIKHFIRQ
ncbi:MAG: PAS domain-containing protein [Bacteroidia bacterium]|nr:PAS domain-containing protein [Bacteroidia bacterium]